mmetsp:Transcript_2648/g.10096  ORF Transcript_2648/g.10096 Transcript_2648/m.10096 type:complete len:169 (-) Transcript_2648:7204-7710(-)
MSYFPPLGSSLASTSTLSRQLNKISALHMIEQLHHFHEKQRGFSDQEIHSQYFDSGNSSNNLFQESKIFNFGRVASQLRSFKTQDKVWDDDEEEHFKRMFSEHELRLFKTLVAVLRDVEVHEKPALSKKQKHWITIVQNLRKNDIQFEPRHSFEPATTDLRFMSSRSS